MEEVAKKGYHFFDLSSENFHFFDLLRVPSVDEVTKDAEMPSVDEVMKDAFKQAEMDVRFMRLFYLCLSHWDSTFTNSNEKSMERLITALENIWREKKENGVESLNRQSFTGLVDIQHEIRLSKIEMEEGFGNLLRCSVKPSKPLPYSEVIQILTLVYESLDEFLNCGAADILKLKKQIGIFRDMIHFLRQSLEILPQNLIDSNNCFRDMIQHFLRQSLVILPQNFTNSNNCIEFMNFVVAFSLKAAFLACMYWAKEANEKAATEMNIVLFDMMHEFIPSTPDVTASYFRILCSTENSQAQQLPINIEAFVAFYFEHLTTTIPNDDYLIFRDQMISHLTFLANYAHENTKEFSEQKSIILHDFMTKTETTFAKARLHYYGFSDSWVGLETAKMVYVSFHPIQSKLYLIEKRNKWHNNRLVYLYEMELTFLRTFMLWLAICDDSDEEIRLRLRSIIVSLQGIWGNEREEKGFADLYTRDITDWHTRNITEWDVTDWYTRDITEWDVTDSFFVLLKEKIKLSKLEIETWLANWYQCSLPSKSSTSNKIQKFKMQIGISVDYILNSLNALVNRRFKMQIETLKDKLTFLHNWLKLSENCPETKELGEFNMLVQVFAVDAAFITFLISLKVDITATEVDRVISNMLQKIKPATPDIARLYFGALKAIYLQRSDSLLFGQTTSIFVDIVFEDSETFSMDDFQILRDDVIFLLTFLNDPPTCDAEEFIQNQIDNHFWEGVYELLPIDDMNTDFSKKKVLLRCFMTKIETVIGNIRMHYCEFPDSPLFDLPKITSPYHLNFLIQNLRNLKERMINDPKFVPFAKYKVIKLEEVLVSMSPLFNYIFELRNELNDTWLQVMNVLHLTECLINLCVSSWFVFDHPIWYYMAYFYDIFDKIKVIKTKVEKIKENMDNVRCIPHSHSVISTFSKQTSTSEIDEVMVGFKDDAKKITDAIRGGHESLDVVSIVGMGGLGKTTLAKTVCSIVKNDFHILAFYSVSQDYNTRMLLLGILKCIIKVDEEISSMTKDDLAHKLKKCLSRKKYLIVLDDIWNVIVWNEVRRSFPDDEEGSRVMLTTRFHEVANKCKIQCKPFHLRFLSKDESWELLQKKVFQEDIPPSSLYTIGRKIAESCKGLPLSIVVIAGVLAGKEKSESLWSEIAENVHFYLSEDEGCKKILELSYNHLPEYLKPCLLYLGAYPEDKVITVNHVIRLWIAEGFVQKSETASIEDVAKEYFHNLVDRSLLIVNGRSSDGEIKTFRVHDLIHNMCQTKCHEGNFFKLGREIAASSSGSETVFCLKENTDYLFRKECYEKNFSMYNQYRISVHATNGSGSASVEDASTLLFFIEGEIHEYPSLYSGVIMNLRHAQVLYSEGRINETHFRHMLSLVNLRHLHVCNFPDRTILSTISNLWNLQSVIVTYGHVDLPETFWKLKNLRYVKVKEGCSLKFSDHAHEQLDKVVSFSGAILSSAKDVEKLLQRLPAVRKLGIIMDCRVNEVEVEVEPLDFCRKLESFWISSHMRFSQINFPSTLKKLTLYSLKLPSTTLSAIAQLHCLRVLNLIFISFMQPRLEMEDLVFQRLVSIHLVDYEMIQWNASAESFPCLEQIQVECLKLEELPPCFLEISTLNKIVLESSPRVKSSALRIQQEQIELGNHVEIVLWYSG